MEMITNATMNDKGSVPGAVRWMVRSVVFIIWFVYDILFAPVFGGGDGNEREHQRTIDLEQAPLLAPVLEEKCIAADFK